MSAKSDNAMQTRDGYLCFCKLVTGEMFTAEMVAKPELGFEELCAGTGVGSKCTACMLNAENLYIEMRRNGVALNSKASNNKASTPAKSGKSSGAKFSHRRIYQLIDALSPDVARRIPGIIPVIVGPGISTVLAFANTVPPVIGSRAPAFEVAVEIRDSDGALIDHHRGRVESGGRLELELSRRLRRPEYGHGLTSGACFLSYRACGRGYLGSIRPHFKVITACSATSVHSAGAGRMNAYVSTCLVNPAERQYVSAVNCGGHTAEVVQTVRSGSGTVSEVSVIVPPRGARLIPVSADTGLWAGAFEVLCRSNREVRWHYVVAEGDPLRISLDHI